MSTQNIFDLVDTWNAGATTFTAIKMNVTDTASASGSLLIDLQVGGVSQFSVTKGGRITAQTLTIGLGGKTSVASNTAVGFQCLDSADLTGENSVGVGYQTLFSNTTGGNNTATGVQALYSNTTGANNTASGLLALFSNTVSSNNTAFGREALRRFVSATGNQTAVGYRALFGGDGTPANNTGATNTGVGYLAGDAISTGSRNTIIGANSDPSAAGGNDQIVVGESLTGKGDDTAFIGGTNGAYNEKNVTTWETTSDERIKKNIVSNGVGLEVIRQINVRNFEYRTAEEITDLPASAAITQPGVQLGVIAQELQAVLPECVTENSTGVLSVNTDQLIWYLVNSVKQLSAEVQTLKGAG